MESILRVRTKDGIIDIPALQGADGLSAYQIWLNAGNTGTEADFLESLKGEGGSARATDCVTVPQIYFEYNGSLATIWDYDGYVTKDEFDNYTEDRLNKEIVKIEYQEDGNWKDISLLLQGISSTPVIRTNKTMFVCSDTGQVVIAVFYAFGSTPGWYASPENLGQFKITYYKD